MGFAGIHGLWRGRRLSAVHVFGAAICAQHAWRGGHGFVAVDHGGDCRTVVSQKPSTGFWLCAVLGTLLVLGFMVMRSADATGHFSLHTADVFLLLAMLSASLGYIGGARLTPSLGAERVICWVLVLSLPITVPMTWLNMPPNLAAIHPSSWWAFAYVAVFSMWLGFFAWYRGLALGGAVRVSQVQLVQPFLSLLFAVPLVG